MAIASFDWKSLQRLLNPQSFDDMSRFLDTVPQSAGKGALIAAGISWGFVAAIGLFTMVQLKDFTELRNKLQETEVLKPIVPRISMSQVNKDELKQITDQFKELYPTMTISSASGKMTIQSKKTSDYLLFREMLGHIVNGGSDWKVSVDSLCIGRECKQNSLNAVLKIEKLKIDKPTS